MGRGHQPSLRFRRPTVPRSVLSNSSGGAGLGLRPDHRARGRHGAIYAGGADGGVFRQATAARLDAADRQAADAIGRRPRLAPDGALWLATGEGNTGCDCLMSAPVSIGCARPLTGVFTMATRVGGAELESTFIHRLQFDGAGSVYAATSRGLWKHAGDDRSRRVDARAVSGSGSFVGGVARPDLQSPYNNICNDVAIQPGTGGRVVIVNCAWRGGAAYNGFYCLPTAARRSRKPIRSARSTRRMSAVRSSPTQRTVRSSTPPLNR